MSRITYTIDYQEAPSEGRRPHYDGEVVGIRIEDHEGFALIPYAGDYVHIDADPTRNRSSFAGVVKYRSFWYQRVDDEHINCHVNIVTYPLDVDTGLLMKE